jgi:hypothetical protein
VHQVLFLLGRGIVGGPIHLDDEVAVQECEIRKKLEFQKWVLATVPLPERSNRWF